MSAKTNQRENTATEERELYDNAWVVAPGVWRLKDLFVNMFVIQHQETRDWVLVDAGLRTSADKIRKLVTHVIGSAHIRPAAIVMTHAHFDHRGALEELAGEWQVPVYAHHQEQPYLNGTASYPPPDPAVGGGAMAVLSFTYPKYPIDISERLYELPDDGSVPGLPGWRWIHTPGHTPGHVSFWRESDGVLIAGDACVTTVQESLISVMTQAKFMSGPPKYFTPDWGAAARSVRELAALEPSVITTGHGQSMYGTEASKALTKLSKDFWQRGMPATGRYVKEPALFDVDGVPSYIPKPKGIMLKRILTAAAIMAVGYIIVRQTRHSPGLWGKVQRGIGKKIMGSSWVALGAAAPASSTAPTIPIIPAL
jgi:glyoxylase-like metal-dependent hydrolase (beta-lactamase superfamily II)